MLPDLPPSDASLRPRWLSTGLPAPLHRPTGPAIPCGWDEDHEPTELAPLPVAYVQRPVTPHAPAVWPPLVALAGALTLLAYAFAT